LDGAFFTKGFSKYYRKDAMVPAKEAEVLARTGEVPKKLKKLKN
jgi:hypothetical protein